MTRTLDAWKHGTVAIALVVLFSCSSCSGLSGTGDLEYIVGDGEVVQVPPKDRGDPVLISGTSLDGDQIDLADSRGEVTVVNVWASWCGPCRQETPLLVAAEAELDATFIGIHIRESRANGLAFERAEGVAYPSIHDEGGETLLAFGERFAPRSPPTTFILDGESRVAAMVTGALPSKNTLIELVQEVESERS
jgi:thiol-disulfide isomerase/thioredoxin